MMKTKSYAIGMSALGRKSLLLLALVLCLSASVFAQATTFTYQGRLTDGGTAANGSYDLEFKLFDGAGAQVGPTVTREDVPVTDGVFTVQLDFGSVFDGSPRSLEIGVRPGPSVDAFTPLAPRQPITATPEALHSTAADTATTATTATTAATATNAMQLGGVAAGNYALTSDPRFTDARDPLAGSANYIQNQNAAAQTANFNIDGDGTAGGTLSGNTINSETQYNIGGNRVLGAAGTNNLFAGINAGTANTSGANSFVGAFAGRANTTGGANSFIGAFAGQKNMTGGTNSFVGTDAGENNTTGSNNSFFGALAGGNNTTGDSNSFVGTFAGNSNTTGSNNTTIGNHANVGANNLTFATALGADAVVNTSNTVVLGRSLDTVKVPGGLSVTGNVDVTGNVTGRNFTGLTFSGNGSGLSSLDATDITLGTLDNARLGVVPTTKGGTGLSSSGAGGNFLRSNGAAWTSAPLQATDIPSGSANYIQNTSAQQANSNFNISGTGTANIFSATTQFDIAGQRILSNAGTQNLFVGDGAGTNNTGSFNLFVGSGAGNKNTTGILNSFAGYGAGNRNTTGGSNSFFGTAAGTSNTTGSDNSFFGPSAGNLNTTGGNNSFFGFSAGHRNTTGNNNTIIGDNADVASDNLTNASAIGAQAQVSQSNSLVLGSINGVNGATADTRVGIGTTAPKEKLHVTGGNVYITQPNSLIITSPNGACWFITVNNAGALSTISVTCP